MSKNRIRGIVEGKGNMERLTSNGNVSEIGMAELAHNACYYGEDGLARYRDCDTDIDARELARKLMVMYGVWDPEDDRVLLEDDQEFDYAMEDCPYEIMDGIEGLIAVFYRNLQAMAELRERLKYYEDLEERLQAVYGDCDGLLEKVVEHLECHKGVDLPEPVFKARLLTDSEVDRWQEYKKLDKQGKLLKLPCAVGDTIFAIMVDENSFEHFHCDAKISALPFDYWMLPIFEETVFLTREEAEAAIQEVRFNHD